MKLINSAVTKFGATEVVAVVAGTGMALGIAAKVVFDYGYKKTKKCLNNRKNKKAE